MKPITRQLLIAAFILVSITVISFGIRQVRFNIHRAGTAESSAIAGTGEATAFTRSSNPKGQSQTEQSLWAGAESDSYISGLDTADTKPDYYTDESYTVDVEPEPEHAKVSNSEKQTPPKIKSLKSDYTKSVVKKSLEKIPLGVNESLYRTEKGELWYVSKETDGSTTKMQVKLNDSGEMIIVDGGNYAESGASKSLQRIPIGEYENIYITGEGGLWYTSEQPDGSTAKVQLQEDIDGEINIVDDGKDE